jgi:VanZ family protein
MAVISGFSTDAFSAEETGRFLLPFLRWLLPWASPATFDLLHTIVRKGAHLTEYAILALLWYRALGWGGSGWRIKAALTALVLAAGFGALDEAHQIYVPSRTPSVVDVGWDSLGAALGLVGRRMVRR